MEKKSCFKVVVGQAMPDVKQGKMFLPKHCQVKPDLHLIRTPHPAFGHPLPQGAREKSGGFTLIELLVVVLIIGILAAVALPQYQKAVEKSRGVQALTLLKSLAQAYERHHLTSGEWANKFDELDIDIPFSGHKHFFASGVQDSVSNGEWALSIQRSGDFVNLNIGRLTGKYRGAGFVVLFVSNTGNPLQQILCVERTADTSVVFDSTLSAGAYCSELFRGQYTAYGLSGRYYILP